MKREFKFRVWDGEHMTYDPQLGTGGQTTINGWFDMVDYIEEVAMQYTGVKYPNGVEIYEGDRIMYSQWNTEDGNSPSGLNGWAQGDVYFDKGKFVVRGN